MDDLSSFCCQNPACPEYGKRDSGNLRVHGLYGRDKRYRLLQCRTCKLRFSERKGTPMYRSHLSPEKADSIFSHLNEGCGVRQTERLVEVHRDTVMRYGRLAGAHSRQLHDELVAFSPGDPRGPVR
jgi:transposase-like protein